VLTGQINDVGAYTRTNINNSFRLGIELQGSAIINTWLKAAAHLSLSRNKIKNFIEYIDDYDNGDQIKNVFKETDIAFSPGIISGATFSFSPLKQLSIDLVGKFVGEQFLDNTSSRSKMLQAFYTQDLRAVYAFSLKRLKGIEIIGQVNNLFNTFYNPNGYTYSYISNNELTTENYYFPMAGTNWLLGVNIRL
jgi:iron complex outermembrane receptor protein